MQITTANLNKIIYSYIPKNRASIAVYEIFKDGELLYTGKSINVANRIKYHFDPLNRHRERGRFGILGHNADYIKVHLAHFNGFKWEYKEDRYRYRLQWGYPFYSKRKRLHSFNYEILQNETYRISTHPPLLNDIRPSTDNIDMSVIFDGFKDGAREFYVKISFKNGVITGYRLVGKPTFLKKKLLKAIKLFKNLAL